ncbi:matrixin family metalloprotease [Mycolicibacterium llatzerense]|uniref:matrixin family metalloprotease n=1 Tax=Mycolicibacterium llatzerense TaxID=280871 RepID=UPI0013A6D61E|nr:matrixin family metalloprotease [Mycolicibacterium llatzerense]
MSPVPPAHGLSTFRTRYGTPRPAFPARPPALRTPAPRPVGPAEVPTAASALQTGHVGMLLGALLVLLTVTGHALFGSGTAMPARTAHAAVPTAPAVTEIPTAAAPSTVTAIPVATVAPEPPAASEVVHFPWLMPSSNGQPATWPCGPIGYRLVSSGAPVGADALVTEAFARISEVSGYQFRRDAPTATTSDGYPGIQISWVTAQQFPDDFRNSTTIGVGGAWNTDGHLNRGYVRLLRDWKGSGVTDFGVNSAGPILLHELGHALGLSHTDDKSAIMYPTDLGATTWSPPEQAALRYLRQSCQ